MALAWISSYLTVCLSCGMQSAQEYIKFGAPGIRLVYRRPCAADCRPLSVFPPVRGRHPSLWLVLAVRCQHAPSQRVAVHPRRREVDVQQQAAVERTFGAPARLRHHIPSGDVQVGQYSVHPVQSARDLGVYVDGALTMRTHITHVLSSC